MVLSLDRYVGKVAVVTGASSGLGAAISELLVNNGIIVVGLARRSQLVEEKAKKLGGKPGKLYAVKADIAKEEDILNAFKWIEKNVGHVHILINNAGIAKENLLRSGDTETWRQVVDINIMGLCIATREAVKIMTANKIHGHIIHINSTVGHKVIDFPGTNLYAASKHAVTALAETLKYELLATKDRIKVTSLSPGLVTTEMTTLNPTNSEERNRLLNTFPILKAEDIAEAVGYVLSTPEYVEIKELTIKPLGEPY